MLNNLNDNLTPQNCGNQQSYGMLTKRIKALEDTVSGYSELVSSQKGQFDDLEAQNGKISTLKTISTETDILNADSVRTGILQSGTTSLGDTTVKSLKISGPEGIVTDIDHADIKTADIGDLHVSGEITLDQPTLDRLELREDLKAKEVNAETVKIKNKKALETLIQELSVGTDFKNINFKSDMIPTWNNLELATKSDVSGLNFKSVVEAAENLPEVAAPGDLYWISSTAEVAVYSDGGFTLTPMPALAAYRTAAEEDKINVEIQANIDKANTDTNARVDETNKNVSTLDTRLTNAQIENDKTHEALTAAIDANKASIEAGKVRVDAIEEDYVKNAPVDGNMYGMKDGTWQDLQKDSNFVPKEYKDETTDSHIFNDANGIDISSTKPITVSTPEEKLETSKEIVNVDYMRKNLSISKDGGAGVDTMMKFKELDGFIMENGGLGANSGTTSSWATRLGGALQETGHYLARQEGIEQDSMLRTKDYIYYFFTNHGFAGASGNSNYRVYIMDKTGNAKRLACNLVDPWYDSSPNYRNALHFAGFHPEYCEKHPELANICYMVHDYRDFVEVWDGPKYLGKIEFPKNSEGYAITKDDWKVDDWYTGLHLEPLRDKPEILLYKTCSQQAYILGLNEDNELDTMSLKRFTMPGYPGNAKIAGGGTYWWGLNELDNSRSSMMRIDSNGNTGSSPLQAEDGSGTCSSVECMGQAYGWTVLKNGDVVFVVNTKFAGADDWTTGFAWCYENPEGKLLPAYYINSTLDYADVSYEWSANGKNFPLHEIGNYVFFFPTSGCYTRTTGAANSSYATDNCPDQEVLNQYCIINKTSHTITYATVPWALPPDGAFPYEWPVKTKGGYTWLLPNYRIKDSKFLVISPSGAQQTVDIGTGSKYTWCNAVCLSQWSGGSRYWTGMPNPMVGVNEDGIGCAVSLERNAVCIFYGNGEYKVWEFPDPRQPERYNKLPLVMTKPGEASAPTPGDGGSLGFGLLTVGKSFILATQWSADTDIAQLVITPNAENPLLEPRLSRFSLRTSGPANRRCYSSINGTRWGLETWGDYEKRTKTLNNIDLTCYGSGDGMPLMMCELPLKDIDTIYLKDGDYVISDTSGTNYKKSIEETK